MSCLLVFMSCTFLLTGMFMSCTILPIPEAHRFGRGEWKMTAADTYETDRREVIGHSLADCVAWARSNPEAFAKTHVWWLRDDDAEAVIVDRDIRDELDAETGEWFVPRKIVTVCVYPPIPDRRFDWIAFYDGEEEAGNYGQGRTEAEAIADFIANYAEGHDERLGGVPVNREALSAPVVASAVRLSEVA